jgi:putative nucleotidyltransferase with HDIG domain
MKRKILFVEEQPKARRELEQSLGTLAGAFDMTFVGSATDALEQIEHQPFDAVVTDLRLSLINGAQLLDEVMQRQPKVLRFVLSDLSDRQATMKCVGTAHQFLSKPCDPRVLAAALERALAYENWLPGEKVRSLLAQLHKLPSPPQLYFEVVKALQSPDMSLETVGALIARDPAMTAKILQLVNSAVFGLKRTVASPAEAVMYLGIDTTKSVILLAHSFSYFDQVKDTGFSVENLWRHSIRTGNFARWIAGLEGVDQAQVEEAYTAGMLHDLGKLALAANLPQKYSEAAMLAASRNVPLWEAEEQVLGANHAELGASMLAIWGLPVAIIEAVALHHHPARFLSQSFCPLTAVHAANAIEHAESSGANKLPVDADYLAQLGLDKRLPVWWEECQQQEKQAAEE